MNQYGKLLMKDITAWFLTQSITIYIAGIRLFLHLQSNSSSETGAILNGLLVSLFVDRRSNGRSVL